MSQSQELCFSADCYYRQLLPPAAPVCLLLARVFAPRTLFTTLTTPPLSHAHTHAHTHARTNLCTTLTCML